MTLNDLTLADNSLLDVIIEAQSDIRRKGSTIKRRLYLKGLHVAKELVEREQRNQLNERTTA